MIRFASVLLLVLMAGLGHAQDQDVMLTPNERRDLARLRQGMESLDGMIANPAAARPQLAEAERRARVALLEIRERHVNEIAQAEAAIAEAVRVQREPAAARELLTRQRRGLLEAFQTFEKRALRERLLSANEFKIDLATGDILRK